MINTLKSNKKLLSPFDIKQKENKEMTNIPNIEAQSSKNLINNNEEIIDKSNSNTYRNEE